LVENDSDKAIVINCGRIDAVNNAFINIRVDQGFFMSFFMGKSCPWPAKEERRGAAKVG